MKLIEALKAYQAIDHIFTTPVKFSEAHTIMMVKRDLQAHAEFYSMKESDLVEECASKGEDGKPIINNGKFQLAPDKVEEYLQKKSELDNVEVTIEPRHITWSSDISAADLDALSTVLIFDCE